MKYRVIVNGVSFYTSGAAIKRGVGDSIHLYDHKMNKVSYDVQISKVV